MMEAITSFSYTFLDKEPLDLIYKGDGDSFGRVIYPDAVHLNHHDGKANFETTVKFNLNPESNSPADGLVFFMAPIGYRFPSNPGGGNLGVFEGPTNPHVFAVEFDVHSNEWDPSFPHVGINIESRVSKMVTQIPLSFLGKEVTLKVTYAAATSLITARATAGVQSVETSCVCDLTEILPYHVQIGLAAATGVLYAIHDVHSWEFDSYIAR